MNGRMNRHELKMADSLLRKLARAEDSAVKLHLYLYCNDRNDEHQRRVRMIKHKISEAVRELEQLIIDNSAKDEFRNAQDSQTRSHLRLDETGGIAAGDCLPCGN